MKKLLKITLALLILSSVDSVAQESIIPEINYSDLEKYISLAKENYPRKKIFDARKEVIKTGIPVAQVSYLDIFTGSYFYRPNDQRVLDPINPYNVNGLQLGININLGSVLQKPYAVKRAKAEYKVAQLEAEEYNTQLEMEVKSRYYDYIQLLNQLKLNAQTTQESKEVNEGLRRRFEKGEITLDVYSQSRIDQSAASAAKIAAEVAYLKAKDALEEIIGKKLSEVK